METEGMELQEDLKDLPASTTTTTPILAAWQNLPNPCKFRGHTIEILEALYDCGNLTIRDIANITGLDTKIAKVYLWNGRKNGIITKIDKWKFMITDFGCYIYQLNKNNIVKGKSRVNQELIEGKSKVNRTFNSEKKPRQLNIDLFLEKEDLTELQRIVVVAMANHYEKTGRPYYMVRDFHQFRDEIGLETKYSYTDVQDLVISLDVTGLIYNTTKGEYLKIGLLKSTIEKLQNA